MSILYVALGGAVGAAARYALDSWVSQWTTSSFPWGTLAVNVSGSLGLGILFALTVERGVLPAEMRAPVLIGFIGAYTTFSTLMLESWRLWEDGSIGLALANVAGSAVLGIAAVFVGLTIGRTLA